MLLRFSENRKKELKMISRYCMLNSRETWKRFQMIQIDTEAEMGDPENCPLTGYNMKILTLNTHSLVEENSEEKLKWFVEGILREKPDIIALQEVNQTADEGWMDPQMLAGQYPVPGCMKIRKDNFAARCAHLLREAGLECFWAWVPVKLGYGKFDEGVAVLSIGRKIR